MSKVVSLLRKVALPLAIAVAFMLWSAFQAYRSSNSMLRDELGIARELAPPYHSIRLSIRPERHIEGATADAQPGWVVTYGSPDLAYAVAFHVNAFGRILAKGTPTAVRQLQSEREQKIEQFRRDFAKLDAAVRVGMRLQDVVAVLGRTPLMFTNSDGTVYADFVYMPAELPAVDWLTNGFSLVITNDVIVKKDYSYVSSY